MRKFFNMALGLILILALSSCSSNSHVSLPKAEDIEKVELTHSDNKANELISDQVEISNLIENLTESSRKTYKGSVNDEPTNVDQYITINFYHKDYNFWATITKATLLLKY